MLKPLIKYAGGKYDEYKEIKKYLPIKINNYYELFVGGGGVFFRLNDEKRVGGESFINDISDSLIDFYESITSDNFENELRKISKHWTFIKNFSKQFFGEFGGVFERLLFVDKNEEFITDYIKDYIVSNIKKMDFETHGFDMSEKIILSLNDKLKRFRKKENIIDKDTVYKCITTCICQAFYFIIRDMYNDWNNNGNKDKYTKEERSAQWMFIREFCFCSMFRFGKDGNFNVPYGGFGYNSKNFDKKIDNIFSKDVQNLFSGTNISIGDFEKTIEKWDFKEDDFLFLDPPYDSTFTDYDNNSFTREDHKRLADCLKKCNCNWLMAIGYTDFIVELYKDYEIIPYYKTYMYQARGKYDGKHKKHIIIRNFKTKKQYEELGYLPLF